MLTGRDLIKYRNSLNSKGYVKLKNLLSMEEFLMCKSFSDYLESLPEEIGRVMKYFERSKNDNSEILNRAEKLTEESHDFNSLINKLNELITLLVGQPYILFKDKINFKMPGAGGFKVHQDAPAFLKFIQEEMFTIMLPLQETNVDNSCLYVADNFFEKSIVPHVRGTIPNKYLHNIDWVPIEQQERDVLLFSTYLFHYSGDNLSRTSRKSYFLTFNSEKSGNIRSSYFKYKRESFPPRVERAKDSNYEEWQSNLARDIY